MANDEPDREREREKARGVRSIAGRAVSINFNGRTLPCLKGVESEPHAPTSSGRTPEAFQGFADSIAIYTT